jgi:hypothetical protein
MQMGKHHDELLDFSVQAWYSIFSISVCPKIGSPMVPPMFDAWKNRCFSLKQRHFYGRRKHFSDTSTRSSWRRIPPELGFLASGYLAVCEVEHHHSKGKTSCDYHPTKSAVASIAMLNNYPHVDSPMFFNIVL